MAAAAFICMYIDAVDCMIPLQHAILYLADRYDRSSYLQTPSCYMCSSSVSRSIDCIEANIDRYSTDRSSGTVTDFS